LPNGSILTSTNEACQLDIQQLPDAARNAHVIHGLTHSSLLSIGKLCDAGCVAKFDANHVNIIHNDTILLTGNRDRRNGLWRLPLETPHVTNLRHTIPHAPPTTCIPNEHCNNAYQTQSIPDLINYLHAAAFSPAVSTWIHAIQNGFFQSWPGLTSAAVRKHLQPSEATAKGHLDQTRKNIRSTKIIPDDIPEQQDDNKTNFLFATILDTGRIYTDQTGRFPITSSQGNQYIMVLYDYDSNAILTEPLKNRKGQEILRAYTKLHKYLIARGFTPQTHWLDNEASTALKDYNRENKIEFQLVPPQMHRRNAAERAIRTWKNHFVAGLCSADDEIS
jgi:hypothetical protein